MLEQKITEQDDVIQTLKLGIQVAAAEQCALVHKFRKEVRQQTVDKQDAVEDATKARDYLAFVQKKLRPELKVLKGKC